MAWDWCVLQLAAARLRCLGSCKGHPFGRQLGHSPLPSLAALSAPWVLPGLRNAAIVFLLLQALVIPNVQSLTADYYSSTSRGTAFGFLWVTISSGGMLGTLFATNIGVSGQRWHLRIRPLALL